VHLSGDALTIVTYFADEEPMSVPIGTQELQMPLIKGECKGHQRHHHSKEY